MKKRLISVLLFGVAIVLLQYPLPAVLVSSAAQNGVEESQLPINATRAAREEKALQDNRRQQLSEKEAALAAKEMELKKLSAKIEAQVKALEDSKKRIDDSLKAQSEAQKKKQDEKTTKMVKLFKTMKADQSAKMLDSLKEDVALLLLTRLDTKTVAKLAPFISQPRLIRWVTNNLQGR